MRKMEEREREREREGGSTSYEGEEGDAEIFLRVSMRYLTRFLEKVGGDSPNDSPC